MIYQSDSRMDLKEEMEPAAEMAMASSVWWLVLDQEEESSWSASSQRIPVDLGSMWGGRELQRSENGEKGRRLRRQLKEREREREKKGKGFLKEIENRE